MIKVKAAFIVIASLMFGCGLDENYKLEAGTYAVSQASSTSDQCGFLGVLQDTQDPYTIAIAVSDATVTFYSDAASASMKPTATLDSNVLTKVSEAVYTAPYCNNTCVIQYRRDLVGDVTSDNIAALTLSFSATVSSGTCDVTDPCVPVAALPCQSSYAFTATKQP